MDIGDLLCQKLKREKRSFARDIRSLEVLTDSVETLWRIALNSRLTPKVIARVYALIRNEVLQFSSNGKAMTGFCFRDDTLGMTAKIAAAAKASGEDNKSLHGAQTYSRKVALSLKIEKRRKPPLPPQQPPTKLSGTTPAVPKSRSASARKSGSIRVPRNEFVAYKRAWRVFTKRYGEKLCLYLFLGNCRSSHVSYLCLEFSYYICILVLYLLIILINTLVFNYFDISFFIDVRRILLYIAIQRFSFRSCSYQFKWSLLVVYLGFILHCP